jgi:hypothetical protein
MKGLKIRMRKVKKQSYQQPEKNGEIETAYNGRTFKSRLEARWAVFFDTLGISYIQGADYLDKDYIPLPLDRDGETYITPSFWLPKQECYIEIKQQGPTQEELDDTRLVSNSTLMDVFIFYGPIRMPSFDRFSTNGKCAERVWYFTTIRDGGRPETSYVDGLHGWAQCPWCLQVGITCACHPGQIKCGCFKYIDPFMQLNQPLNRLIDLSPEIVSREPIDKSSRFPNNPFYRLQVSNWWADKCHRLTYTGDSPRLTEAYRTAQQARFDYQMALERN